MKTTLEVNTNETILSTNGLTLKINSGNGAASIQTYDNLETSSQLSTNLRNDHHEPLKGIAAVKCFYLLLACRAINPLPDPRLLDDIRIGINNLGVFYQPSGPTYDEDTDKHIYSWERIPFDNGDWQIINDCYTFGLYGAIGGRFKITREWHNGLHYAECIFILADHEWIYSALQRPDVQSFMGGK